MPARTAIAGLAVVALVLGCEKVKATTDRAMVTLQLRPACPDPVDGRAAGADSPEGAMGCFRHAIANDAPSMLLRVTCRSKAPASCKQNDATQKEAEKAMADLKKQTWTTVLGKWDDDGGKTVTFAVDTHPGEKRVSTVSTCKIVEGDKWAVCDIGEVPRDLAEQKMK